MDLFDDTVSWYDAFQFRRHNLMDLNNLTEIRLDPSILQLFIGKEIHHFTSVRDGFMFILNEILYKITATGDLISYDIPQKGPHNLHLQ